MNLKMKFKLFILLYFISSCSPHYTKLDNRQPYNSKGFAYIYHDKDYESKFIKNEFNNEELQISHKDLNTGTLLKITNPKTRKSLVMKNLKKTKYPDFYKILITKKVADNLNIDTEFPFVEVLEIKKNKSFIAKKAKIFNEEKKISSNAPITSVKIANISKKVPNQKKNVKAQNMSILVASFYSNEAAKLLIQRITRDVPYYDRKKLTIKKKSSKEFEVLSGPYKSIILLKNDYIDLKNFGFEELDIFINE